MFRSLKNGYGKFPKKNPGAAEGGEPGGPAPGPAGPEPPGPAGGGAPEPPGPAGGGPAGGGAAPGGPAGPEPPGEPAGPPGGGAVAGGGPPGGAAAPGAGGGAAPGAVPGAGGGAPGGAAPGGAGGGAPGGAGGGAPGGIVSSSEKTVPVQSNGPTLDLDEASIEALKEILKAYNNNPSTRNINEDEHLIPDFTELQAANEGIDLAGRLAGTILGDVAAKFVRYTINKYVEFGTSMFGMIPPEVKIAAVQTGLENTDEQLLVALNTLIVQYLQTMKPKTIETHLVNFPKNNVFHPGIMKDDAFIWKLDGIDGLGNDQLPWDDNEVITASGGGRRTKRNLTKRNLTKRNLTKRNLTKRSRTKRSRTKRSRTKRSRTKRNRTKRNRTKRNNVN